MVEIVEKSRAISGGVIAVDFETVSGDAPAFFPVEVDNPRYLSDTAEPTHDQYTRALFAATEDDSTDEPPDFLVDDGADD
jgi:hypothetical protein